MTMDLRTALDAWRSADADARAAERLLVQTCEYHLAQQGPAVTEGLMKEVAQFRQRANDRFARAMALMASAAAGMPSLDRAGLAAERQTLSA